MSRAFKHVRRCVAMVGVAAGLCVPVALVAAPAASATSFCGGYVMSPGGSCSTANATNASVVQGSGDHSVCVALAPYGPIRCSGGPGQLVVNNYGTVLHATPWISNNAPGNTTVLSGDFF
jgi:hypothetical protein